jgi:DNA-binding CsgD family transcriptional regulator
VAEIPFGLTEKEREALHLLTRGHDVKSAAATLGLSVHTVNERLREARIKTGAGSSRGAARLLADIEHPEFSVPPKFVVTDRAVAADIPGRRHPDATPGSPVANRWGSMMIVTAIISATVSALVFAGAQSASNASSTPARPRVVSTFPAPGAVVKPGRIDLRVTFDRPMRQQSFSFVQKSPDTYPDCGSNRPAQSADGRTFTLACRIEPGRQYEIWFNSEPYMNFADEKDVAAIPHGLRFRTR